MRERVAIVVRPVDLVLLTLRAVLLPILAVVVSLRALQLLASSVSFDASNWVRVLVVGVSALTYVFIIQTPTISKRVDRAFAMTRRRAVLACNHASGVEHRSAGLACRLTPEHMRAPTFRYDQQVDVVDRLVAACADTTDSTFWFVEGVSGTGKSRTAFMLVDRLVRDPNLFELTNRTYFYDLAAGGSVQEVLLSRLGTSRHENAVVIVDNFQRVNPETIRNLTRRLVDGTSGSSERVIVFLARPMESWNLSPGSDVRLVSEAKKQRRHFSLTGTSEEPVVAEVSRIDAAAAQLVRDLRGRGVASAAQLQVAQIVARHGSAPQSVTAMLRLITGQAHGGSSSHYATVLGIVTGLAMHRGSFTRGEYIRSAIATPKNASRTQRWVASARLIGELRRLRRAGFLPTTYLGRRKYLFHEAFAELCIDRLATQPAFTSALSAVGARRIVDGGEDASIRWLLATEIHDTESMTALFDQSLLTGAYSQMSSCVERASLRHGLPSEVQLQRGILLNRVGDFTSSKNVMGALDGQLDHTPELEAQMITSSVEARHDSEAAEAIALLQDNGDPFVRRSGDYWRAHVDAHLGQFASRSLRSMADEAAEDLSHDDTYWRLYQVARMHFDSLRHAYLEGSATPDSIQDALDSGAAHELRGRLATFEALTSLYGRAHLLGHVLVPNLAIFNIAPTREAAALVGVPATAGESVSDLAIEMSRLYNSARDEFWQYGDRESSFLQADVLNAQLVVEDVDFEAVGVRLFAYERFLNRADYADLASYPCLYFFRWHMLQYYAVLLEGSVGAAQRADEHMAEAAEQLKQIERLDTACGNSYGLFRQRMLAALHQAAISGVDVQRFEQLHQEASANGYGFENRLAGHVVRRGLLTVAELRQIIRFYPIVHQ